MNSSVRFAFCVSFCLYFCTTAVATVTTTGSVEPANPSSWTPSTAGYVGRTYNGTLFLEGSNVYTQKGILGDKPNASGSVIITSNRSAWDSSEFIVGNEGSGELSILNGGTVSNGSAIFGFQSGSTGTVTVSGTGSVWENGGELTVGHYGNSVLNINHGGLVMNHTAYTSYFSSATSSIHVSGDGSTWFNQGDLTVGNEGNSTLNILDKGLVRIAGTLTIDAERTGKSFINLASGGMLALSGEGDDSLDAFLDLVEGTDAIRWWNASLDRWSSLASASRGTNYTLEYLTEGKLAGHTLLTVGNTIVPGDANGDGRVDGSDVTILAGNWQTLSGATYGMGDFNGDGRVDGSDVTILAGNWQTGVNTTAATPLAVSVPEPGTLFTLLFGLLALGFVRHIQ